MPVNIVSVAVIAWLAISALSITFDDPMVRVENRAKAREDAARGARAKFAHLQASDPALYTYELQSADLAFLDTPYR